MRQKTNTVEVPELLLDQPRAVLARLKALTTGKPRELTPTWSTFIKGVLRYSYRIRNENDDVKFSVSDLRAFFGEENDRLHKKRYPINATTIMRRLKDLDRAGVVQGFKIGHTPGGVELKNYRFGDLYEPDWHTLPYQEHANARKLSSSQRKLTIHSAVRMMKASNDYLINDLTDTKSKSDGFFTGCLDRGMRGTEYETPLNNEIYSDLTIKNVQISILTTAHYQIATRSDQRIIRAIITLIATTIDEQLEKYQKLRKAALLQRKSCAPALIDASSGVVTDDTTVSELDKALMKTPRDFVPNDFYIDVFDIARLCHYNELRSGYTRACINESIRRLYDTNFRVHLNGEGQEDILDVMALFGLKDTSMDFRFITDLKSLRVSEFEQSASKMRNSLVSVAEMNPFSVKELKRVRLWQISIDKTLYEHLLDSDNRRLYRAHDEIMADKRGLSQTLYNYLCSIIGRSAPRKGEQERTYNKPLKVLRDTLWPARPYKAFEKDFMAIMQDYAAKKGIECTEDSVVNLPAFGFLFTVTRVFGGELHVRVRRNKRDSLAGDHSFHNLALHSEQTTLDF